MVRVMFGMIMLLIPSVGSAADITGDGAQQPNMLLQLGPLILLMVVFFFFTSRSQKKKQKQHEDMLSSISRGDTIVTAGGFFGKVCEILDDSFVIEIAEGTRARVLKGSVSSRRESAEASRPRRVKKRKRVVRKETTDAETATQAAGASPKPLNEGVTAEENEVLINGSGTASEDEKNVSTEKTDQ